jgi:hypothetical protein
VSIPGAVNQEEVEMGGERRIGHVFGPPETRFEGPTPDASGAGRVQLVAPAGRILFVDDNMALAENLAEIVEKSGYEAAIAASAEAAIDLVAARGVSGIGLIETVRRSG